MPTSAKVKSAAVQTTQGPHGIPRTGTMNSLERWRRFWKGQSVDHLPDYEFGWWDENFDVWPDQGMPGWVDGNSKGDRFFGLEQYGWFPIGNGVRPGFSSRLVEDKGDRRIIMNGGGVLCEVPKDGHSTIPRFIKFPIETRADWEEFKKRLDKDDPFRLPEFSDAFSKKYERRDYPLAISCGSLFGWIRDWMGFENLCVMVMDDRALIEEMVEHLADLQCHLLAQVLPKVQIDLGHFWEDIAFRSGPMVSPEEFKSLTGRHYRRITDLLHKHDVNQINLDCDGNILSLVPIWLDNGVNMMFPLEVHSGTDPVLLRKKFGRGCLLMGGVDKMQLIAGKEAIDAELARLAPVVADGGFIPHVDHRCPPDVTYENYLYYLKRKREMFGIPQPAWL
jgi:hypothetical protein